MWLSVVTDLQGRGVQDIFIACMDGLSGFREAVLAVFPRTQIQRCIIHQIRNSLKYVTWTDRKFFLADLRLVYQTATREAAEAQLRQRHEKWGDKYAIAIRSSRRTSGPCGKTTERTRSLFSLTLLKSVA
jgi:putative transposase